MLEELIMSQYREKIIQAIYDGVYIKNRFPIFTQNVKAYISVQVDIRMVNLH